MAYNSENHLKRVEAIMAIYAREKEYDIPDTFILRHVLPKNGIHLSYRTLMNYKKTWQQHAASKTPTP